MLPPSGITVIQKGAGILMARHPMGIGGAAGGGGSSVANGDLYQTGT
jgi:hypothetical protein